MSIPYLDSGESITADSRNLIYERFDDKLTEALDSHSLFFLYNHIPRYLFGRKFFFWKTSAVPFWCKRFFGDESSTALLGTNGLHNYDNNVFSNAVNDTDVFDSDQTWAETGVTITPPAIVHDVARKLVRIKFPVKAHWDAAGIALTEIPGIGFIPDPSFFNYSLKVETKMYSPDGIIPPEPYRVLLGQYFGDEQTQWEREHLYENAELILEGKTVQLIHEGWRKYKFFRIHNFNSRHAVVVFFNPGGTIGKSITIPPWSSRCVRRDGDVWTEGYNHLHKVLPNDPRVFDGSADAPLHHSLPNCQNNNVFNPKMIADICETFQSLSKPRFNIDPAQFWNAKDVYCNAAYSAASSYSRETPTGGYFGNPDSAATKLGDLMFHKGKLLDIKIYGDETEQQQIDFKGFDSIATDLAAVGISVSYDGDGNLIFSSSEGDTHDFIGLSTNLICDAGRLQPYAPALPVNPSASLGRVYTTLRIDGTEGESSTNVAWVDSHLGSNGNFDFETAQKTQSFFQPTAQFVTFRYNQTVADYMAYFASDPASTISSKAIRFTGFGALFSCDISTPINKNVTNLGAIVDLSTLGYGNTAGLSEFDGENLNQKIILRLSSDEPYAVLSVQYPSTVSWPNWTVASSFFVNYPRNDQFYGEKIRIGTPTGNIFNSGYTTIGAYDLHPDFTDYLDKTPASEATVIPIENAPQKSGIGFLSSFSYQGNKFISIVKWLAGEVFAAFGTGDTSNPDWYKDNRNYFINGEATREGDTTLLFDRFPETIDTYNNLASLVNGIVSVVRMDFGFVFPELVTDSTSPFGQNTTIRPANHFATITAEATESMLNELGIPIKTIVDLPGSYSQLITVKNRFKIVDDGFAVDHDGDYPELETLPFIFEESGANTAAGGKFLNSIWKSILFNNNDDNATEYKWVTVEDMQAAADDLGLRLVLQRAVLPSVLEFFPGTYSYMGDTPRGKYVLPAKFAAFVPSTSPEWISDPDTYRVREDYDPAINLNLGAGSVEIIAIGPEFRKRNWSGLYQTQRLHEPDRNRKIILFQNYSENPATVVKIPEHTILWTPSPDGIGGVSTLWYHVPAQYIQNPSIGTVSTESLPVGNNFITASTVCDRLQFFIDNRVATPDAE